MGNIASIIQHLCKYVSVSFYASLGDDELDFGVLNRFTKQRKSRDIRHHLKFERISTNILV